MSGLLTDLLYVAGVAGMFLILIAPHEAGHFAFAKLFKVRVIEFSVGAGMKLWATTRNGTLYALRLIPILGYVRMGGMEAGDLEDPNGFHTKSALKRILILAGGPAANFLMAMILVTAVGLTQLNTDPGKVLNVVAGSPAAAAGLQTGDSIKSVNGKPFTSPGLIRQEEDAHRGAPIQITGVHPDGKTFSYVVTPSCPAGGICTIGIGVPRQLVGWRQAVTNGVTFPVTAVTNIVQGLGMLVTGQVQGGLLGPNGLTGPIGIADVAAQSVAAGWTTYILIVALLSVALGFTNLLPLLALDGGRMVVVLIEVLRRRPFDRTMELNFQRWGLVALLALAALISFLDIQRIATGQFPGLR